MNSGKGMPWQLGELHNNPAIANDLGHTLYNVRQRLKANRKQIKKACYACRLKKAKCDDARPCKRCVAAGKADTCCNDYREETESAGSDEDNKTLPELAVVQRPLQERLGIFLNDDRVPGHAQAIAQIPGPLRFFYNAGHPQHKLQSIFDSLPPRLSTVATKMMRAFDIVMQHKAAQMQAARAAMGLQLGPSASTTPLELSMQRLHDGRPGQCKYGVWMNPVDLSRQGLAISFNSETMTGMHFEEFTARAANHEIGIPFSDVDTFCVLMDDLLNMERRSSVRYLPFNQRSAMSTRDCAYKPANVFVRWDTEKTMDAAMESMQVMNKFTLCTVEEYEEARRVTPQLCRPFRNYLDGGSDPSATELLLSEGIEVDTFERLRQTDRGRKYCDSLAAHLEEKAAALMHMADMVSGPNLCSHNPVLGAPGPRFQGGPPGSSASPPSGS